MNSIKVTVDNSLCYIEGLDEDTFDDLRTELSYKEDATSAFFRGGFGAATKYLLGKRGDFPTGLLYLVKDFLSKQRIACQFIDKRIKPKLNQAGLDTLFISNELTPRLEQHEAARAALKYERGIIVGPTGVGKSFIGALICDAFQVPTLYVVPTLALKSQLTKDLQQFFGEEKVGPLSIDGERKFFITVENVDGLSPTKILKGIDLVIIDEFHHSGAETYRDLNKKAWASVYYKIGLTATPFRSKDSEKLLLESVLSQVIYEIDYFTAVKKGYIVPLEAYYYELPKVRVKGNPKNYASVYSELVVNSIYRNLLISILLDNLKAADVSALCLVKQIPHGRNLQNYRSKGEHPFATGENDDNRQLILEFNLRESKTLIGTVGILGEGVDTKPAEFVLLAGGGKSKNQFMQNVGRVFRIYKDKVSGKAILFYDPSHKWMIAHFKQCKKYLREEYGVEIVKLDLPDEVQEFIAQFHSIVN